MWLLQAAPPHGALGGGRPAECGEAEGARANAWERAKQPNLRPYCDLIASGSAKLASGAESALVAEVPRIADEAEELLAGRAAPPVLKGRAYLRLGRPAEALEALALAKRRDARALDDPTALLAWARANARTGRVADAASAYRAALPRLSLLPTHERATASLEAGLAAMGLGEAGLDEAVAMLRQARREAHEGMQIASAAALALALDRGGLRGEARAVLDEGVRGDAAKALADARVASALADAGASHEGDALVACALEARDPARAKAAWKAYVEGPGGSGPWADHARARAGGPSSPPRGRGEAP